MTSDRPDTGDVVTYRGEDVTADHGRLLEPGARGLVVDCLFNPLAGQHFCQVAYPGWNMLFSHRADELERMDDPAGYRLIHHETSGQ